MSGIRESKKMLNRNFKNILDNDIEILKKINPFIYVDDDNKVHQFVPKRVLNYYNKIAVLKIQINILNEMKSEDDKNAVLDADIFDAEQQIKRLKRMIYRFKI